MKASRTNQSDQATSSRRIMEKIGGCRSLNLLWPAFFVTLGLIGPAMAQERILISSDWGKVTAELVDNNATRSLVQMLPLTIETVSYTHLTLPTNSRV